MVAGIGGGIAGRGAEESNCVIHDRSKKVIYQRMSRSKVIVVDSSCVT
jgi:hypothetical protein